MIARRFFKFCLVGGTGLLVDMAVLWLLVDLLAAPWPVTVSKVIAATIAMANNFWWNEWWTFRDVTTAGFEHGGRLRRYLKFNVLCAAGLGLSVLTLGLLVYGLHLNLYLANLFAIGTGAVWNFLMNYWFCWEVHRSPSQ